MKRRNEEEHICMNCNEDFDELVTRQGFLMSHYVEFVCLECFKELEGVEFDEYSADDYYGLKSEGAENE